MFKIFDYFKSKKKTLLSNVLRNEENWMKKMNKNFEEKWKQAYDFVFGSKAHIEESYMRMEYI